MYKGAALNTVSAFLGHANTTTTSRYVKTSPVRMVEALERLEASAEPTGDVAESRQVSELR